LALLFFHIHYLINKVNCLAMKILAIDGSGGMGGVTGIPLACGLKMLLDGRINIKGVLAPESGVINPEEFFSEVFSVLTENTAEKIPLEDFIKVSRSWEKS